MIPEQIALPARMKAIPVSTVQKYANPIQCGTMLAKTRMPMRWSKPKRMGGNPNIQRAAIVTLACNRESVEAMDTRRIAAGATSISCCPSPKETPSKTSIRKPSA